MYLSHREQTTILKVYNTSINGRRHQKTLMATISGESAFRKTTVVWKTTGLIKGQCPTCQIDRAKEPISLLEWSRSYTTTLALSTSPNYGSLELHLEGACKDETNDLHVGINV